MTNRQIATLIVLKTELVYRIDDFDSSEKSKNRIFEALDLYHDCVMGRCAKSALKKYELRIAKQMIADWINAEYRHNARLFAADVPEKDFSIAYTELGDNNEFPVNVYVNLKERKLKFWMVTDRGGRWIKQAEEKYDSLDQMMDQCLECLDFCTLVGTFNPYVKSEVDLFGIGGGF